MDDNLDPSMFTNRSSLEKLLLFSSMETMVNWIGSAIFQKVVQELARKDLQMLLSSIRFGMSLANKSEPIVDRHVLRAFCLWKLSNKSEPEIENIRLERNISNNDCEAILPVYKSWFSSIDRSCS